MIEGHGDDQHRYKDIRSNFSSNVYPFADLTGLKQHLCRKMDLIGSYPQPSAADLERRIAEFHGMDEDQVMVTNGATDAIYLIAETFRDSPTFHVVEPTFSEYADACRMMGYMETERAHLCWMCNPNNPTGMVAGMDDIRKLALSHDMLVLDESYGLFTTEKMPSPQEATSMGNVILLRSMTKRYGIPGLRLGYIIAPSHIIGQLRRHRRPWAVNALALEAGMWLLDHDDRAGIPSLDAYLCETRRLRQLLNAIKGIEAMETQTHFFLATIEGHTARDLKDYLARQHGMLIRDASNFRGLTPHHFRICALSPAENDALAAAVGLFMEKE